MWQFSKTTMYPVWAGLPEKSEKAEQHSVKGRPRDERLLLLSESGEGRMLITACPGDLEMLQEKQKEEMRKTRNPCSLGPSPVCLHQARHAPVLLVVLTGPSRAGMSFESAASPSCASFPQVASLPLGHPWEWGADSFWVQSIKRSFVIFFLKNKP